MPSLAKPIPKSDGKTPQTRALWGRVGELKERGQSKRPLVWIVNDSESVLIR